MGSDYLPCSKIFLIRRLFPCISLCIVNAVDIFLLLLHVKKKVKNKEVGTDSLFYSQLSTLGKKKGQGEQSKQQPATISGTLRLVCTQPKMTITTGVTAHS